MKKTHDKNESGHYGLYKPSKNNLKFSKNNIKFVCLSPQIAFDSLIKEKPFKIILTSGSLPSNDEMT